MGYSSTLEYVKAAAAAVLHQTGLLPHINAGLLCLFCDLELVDHFVHAGILYLDEPATVRPSTLPTLQLINLAATTGCS